MMAKAPQLLASRQFAKWDAEYRRLRDEAENLERIFEAARTALHRKNAECNAARVERTRWEEALTVPRIRRAM